MVKDRIAVFESFKKHQLDETTPQIKTIVNKSKNENLLELQKVTTNDNSEFANKDIEEEQIKAENQRKHTSKDEINKLFIIEKIDSSEDILTYSQSSSLKSEEKDFAKSINKESKIEKHENKIEPQISLIPKTDMGNTTTYLDDKSNFMKKNILYTHKSESMNSNLDLTKILPSEIVLNEALYDAVKNLSDEGLFVDSESLKKNIINIAEVEEIFDIKNKEQEINYVNEKQFVNEEKYIPLLHEAEISIKQEPAIITKENANLEDFTIIIDKNNKQSLDLSPIILTPKNIVDNEGKFDIFDDNTVERINNEILEKDLIENYEVDHFPKDNVYEKEESHTSTFLQKKNIQIPKQEELPQAILTKQQSEISRTLSDHIHSTINYSHAEIADKPYIYIPFEYDPNQNDFVKSENVTTIKNDELIFNSNNLNITMEENILKDEFKFEEDINIDKNEQLSKNIYNYTNSEESYTEKDEEFDNKEMQIKEKSILSNNDINDYPEIDIVNHSNINVIKNFDINEDSVVDSEDYLIDKDYKKLDLKEEIQYYEYPEISDDLNSDNNQEQNQIEYENPLKKTTDEDNDDTFLQTEESLKVEIFDDENYKNYKINPEDIQENLESILDKKTFKDGFPLKSFKDENLFKNILDNEILIAENIDEETYKEIQKEDGLEYVDKVCRFSGNFDKQLSGDLNEFNNYRDCEEIKKEAFYKAESLEDLELFQKDLNKDTLTELFTNSTYKKKQDLLTKTQENIMINSIYEEVLPKNFVDKIEKFTSNNSGKISKTLITDSINEKEKTKDESQFFQHNDSINTKEIFKSSDEDLFEVSKDDPLFRYDFNKKSEDKYEFSENELSQELIDLKAIKLVQDVLENLDINTIKDDRKKLEELPKMYSTNLLLPTKEDFRPKSPIPPLTTFPELDSANKNYEGSYDSLNNESVESNSSDNSLKKLKKYEHLLAINGDNISVESLQEFERIERELLQNKIKQEDEHRNQNKDNENELEKNNQNINEGSKSGSISSLMEFENLEQEVREAVGSSTAAITDDIMILSDIREESEEAEAMEAMSTREDDDEDDDGNDLDSLSGIPYNSASNIIAENYMLSSVDSLMGHKLMDTSIDSLEADLLQGHKKKVNEDSFLLDSLEDGGTDTTFQEYQENETSEETINLFPTTITTLQTTQIKEDGTTETITKQVRTRVRDPIHSHVRFSGPEGKDILNEGQQIRSVDEEGNITTTTCQRFIH